MTTRDPLKQPFSSNSIWNMPIGDGATYVPAQLKNSWDQATYGADGPYAPMPSAERDHLVLTPTEPITAIGYSSAGWDSTANRCAVTGTTLFSAPIPSGYTVPHNGENSCAAILAADGRTIKQCQPLARCTTGSPATAMVTFADEDLYGPGITGSHGGSGLSALGGTLRIGELRPTQTGPKHALKVCVHTATALYKATTFAEAYRWPATTADGYAVGHYGADNNNSNADMKMGSLLAIPPSTDINTLGLETTAALQLAWTLQNYGAYIVDDTWGPGFSIAVEDSPDGSFETQFQADWGFAFSQRAIDNTAWTRDMQRLIAALYCVSNNSDISIGGGGTPRQPLAPEIAPSTRFFINSDSQQTSLAYMSPFVTKGLEYSGKGRIVTQNSTPPQDWEVFSLIWNWTSSGGYYYLRLMRNSWQVIKVTPPFVADTVIASANVGFSVGAEHTWSIKETAANTFEINVNGTVLCTITDTDCPAGYTGFRVAGCKAEFDNVRVACVEDFETYGSQSIASSQTVGRVTMDYLIGTAGFTAA